MAKFKSLLIQLLAVALLCSTAQAGDFSRKGWYAGLNITKGFNFITEALDAKSNGKLNTGNTWGFNMHGGYRFLSWLSLEANYEFMDAFSTDGTLGNTDIRTNTVTIGPKFLLPFWRVQPYFLIGIGAQHSRLAFTSDFPVLFESNSGSSWSTAWRPALGIDGYITEKLLANIELGGVFIAGKFENESMSMNDPIYLSIGAGLQYRF